MEGNRRVRELRKGLNFCEKDHVGLNLAEYTAEYTTKCISSFFSGKGRGKDCGGCEIWQSCWPALDTSPIVDTACQSECGTADADFCLNGNL